VRVGCDSAGALRINLHEARRVGSEVRLLWQPTCPA
jgi:hypothetical protein